MTIPALNLEDAINALGNAYVFYGDVHTVGGLNFLGVKEGDATVEFNEEYNDLTAPEVTGPAIVERKLAGMNPDVTIPLMIDRPELLSILSPTGAKSGGTLGDVAVVETALVLIPEDEYDPTLGYDPAATTPAWTPAAPTRAVWFGRGHFLRPGLAFRREDGGKHIYQVTYKPLWNKPWPDGLKLFAIGDPVAQGVTNLAV